MCFDRMDHYYDKALKSYCEAEKKDPDTLTDEEQDEVALRACNHIGFFFTWLIRRDLIGAFHRERPHLLERVQTGKLLGADFFLAECDGKFWDDDVCPEALPFVEAYYGGGLYWNDYVNWVLNDLCDLPLEFVGGWEDYLRFEPLLDRAYKKFCREAQKAEKSASIHAGHRQRMKEEFLAGGLEGWPDHRVLELLLFFSRVQGDTNPLAHALIDKFGSLTGVFHATHEQLMTVKGVGENTATLIQIVLAIAARYLQERADLRRIYRTSKQFWTLLKNNFLGARNELVYMVCLDAKYKKIASFMLGEGIADAATITTRKVMETALACNASIVVLAHNHVSGLALPSAEDISTTLHLKRSLKQVGILLYDHLIFVEEDMTSMRDSGYLQD